MLLLTFNDILRKIEIEPKDVLLIRHPISNKGFKACLDVGMEFEYTCHQKKDFGKNYKYWAVFFGDNGCYASFYGLFEKGAFKPDIPKYRPKKMPECEKYTGELAIFDLRKMLELEEYENRLIIDWGKGTINWYQKAENEKPVVAIQDKVHKPFTSYEDIILTYDELKEIVDNPIVYADWKKLLSSIYAIYLIVDKNDGKQYVGSAYGDEGLYGRWSCYINTLHGGDKKIKEIICNLPKRYNSFQFSILQVLPKTLSDDEVIEIESQYKKKLLSKEFGLNNN